MSDIASRMPRRPLPPAALSSSTRAGLCTRAMASAPCSPMQSPCDPQCISPHEDCLITGGILRDDGDTPPVSRAVSSRHLQAELFEGLGDPAGSSGVHSQPPEIWLYMDSGLSEAHVHTPGRCVCGSWWLSAPGDWARLVPWMELVHRVPAS